MSNWAKCASHNRPQENSTKMCAYQCDSDKHCLLTVAPSLGVLSFRAWWISEFRGKSFWIERYPK